MAPDFFFPVYQRVKTDSLANAESHLNKPGASLLPPLVTFQGVSFLVIYFLPVLSPYTLCSSVTHHPTLSHPKLLHLVFLSLHYPSMVDKMLFTSNLFSENFPAFCCSVAKLCPALCDPMDGNIPGFPTVYHLPEFAQALIESAMPYNHLILCCPLLLLPSIFPNIRIFSNESDLHIRLSKYWSFSFSISPFNEYSGLISFRIDWFDLLAVQRILKSLFQYNSKALILQH